VLSMKMTNPSPRLTCGRYAKKKSIETDRHLAGFETRCISPTRLPHFIILGGTRVAAI
jgi:hypothetical protein